MKTAQLVTYNKPVEINQAPDPAITGPFDVILKIGGAGSAAPISTSLRGSGWVGRAVLVPS